jgi:hypothetical protein
MHARSEMQLILDCFLHKSGYCHSWDGFWEDEIGAVWPTRPNVHEQITSLLSAHCGQSKVHQQNGAVCMSVSSTVKGV